MSGSHHHKVSAAALLVTLGIIYGDIGTSPLYVLKAIVGEGNIIETDTVLGGLSCIFWTLTLQTTIKYVILTLRADNKGEGGIFALYALVKKAKIKWLMFPAIIGGSALLADGFITPPISIASAIEGLRVTHPHIQTIPIVIGILIALFTLQQFGTKFIGKFFGPVMFIWFSMLIILGSTQIAGNFEVLSALNPYYAYHLLSSHPEGFLVLGAVFLCTTGAEALYSDLGHCGRQNIRITWIFVKTALVINYFGQGAWLITHQGEPLNANPFYAIMSEHFMPTGIAIATAAAIVASQALISGSFTLINEAIRLNFWPKVRVKYPTDLRGQLYIPSMNWFMLAGCIGVMLYFKESSEMEAAYGLAIVLTMLMTTTLLTYYMVLKNYNGMFITLCLLVYLAIEISFLVANLQKFMHGGWITLLLACILISVMLVWYYGKKIRARYVEFVRISDYLSIIEDLSHDESIPKYATHLVYLTNSPHPKEIESKTIYSILNTQPKRADIYWFVHIEVVDEPYTTDYKVSEFIHDDVIRIDFKLGFRVAPRINLMFRKVVEEMVKNKEVDITSRYKSLSKNNVIGDFRFILSEKILSYENDLPFHERVILNAYDILKKFSQSEDKAFGLDSGSVTVEQVPLVISPVKTLQMNRIE
ncbi:MAG: KUP/HAK/KT family potassium transporter [Bacteroidetes bacterium]|nr:KUP/HAK/KT family potassium transporter [Bacteroidota bacterium]